MSAFSGMSPKLRRFHIVAAALGLIAVSLCVMVMQFSGVRDNTLPGGAPLGGDYVAFYTAARAAAEGDAAALYSEPEFEALLKEKGPPRERYGLTWQYPPTYYFVVLPLMFFGFKAGYAFWSGLGALGFFGALRAFGLAPIFLLVVAAAPSTTHAFITGQNGFLSAVLLGAAALLAKDRPIIAGLAAALLTVKPQLGVLIPIAFLAAGAWRAFAVASVGALLLAGASVLAFGADAWLAFVNGAGAAAENLASGKMPLFKMASPYAALRLATVPADIAMAGQIAATACAAAAVFLVWRRVADRELRAAALVSLVFLAAPYGFYYEFVILALPMALIARRAMRLGWLPFEQAAIALVFILPLYSPGDPVRDGLSLEFFVVALAAATTFRRIVHEAPEAFRSDGLSSRPSEARAGIP